MSSRIVRLCLVLGLWLSACSDSRKLLPLVTAVPTPEATSTITTQAIDAGNVTSLSEVRQLAVDGAGPVAALAFTSDLQTLHVAYTNEWSLRQWAFADGILLKEFDLKPFGLGGASFDAEATRLATSAGVEWEAHKSEEEYWDLWVWETQTGKAVREPFADTGVLYSHIQLNVDGRWVLELMAIVNTNNGFVLARNHVIWEPVIYSGSNGLGSTEDSIHARDEEYDFDVVALDAQGEFFAAANEAGKVVIYPFIKSTSLINSTPVWVDQPYITIESGDVDALGPTPLALAFDPTRRWLARVRGTELTIWDLQSDDYKRQLEVSIGETAGITASLAFNLSGDLLGVGTVNGWQIWNVMTGELVASGADVEVYAVAFSPDGRLFAWGDSSGTVHIWGVP